MNVPGGGGKQRQQPQTWDDYERGGWASSVASTGSHVQWDELERPPSRGSHHLGLPRQSSRDSLNLRRRRSSISNRFDSLRQAGGVNSIDNFTRSWQRAAGFYEITQVPKSFVVCPDGEDEAQDDYDYEPGEVDDSPQRQRSLLGQALEEGSPSKNAIEESEAGDAPLEREQRGVSRRPSERRRSRGESILTIEPALASPFGSNYGTMYGSLSSRVNESSLRHAGKLFMEQQIKGVTQPDNEREPLLVRQVEEDGVKYNIVVGQSTVPQTIFNSVNVLIGVGLRSLPLAFKYSGWLIGTIFFGFAAVVTQYTAKLLAKCLEVDSSLITFADLAYISFGNCARIATSILFSMELIGANVALVILFADSLDALIAGWGVLAWKLVCGVLLIPLGFLPLRLLSFTSILGILCCFSIVLVVISDGLIKPHTLGSLREPATTYLFPLHWTTIPLSFGLLMAPWGGHSVFPNIYRDMRHPYKYKRSVDITYGFTFSIDMLMAVNGLMFGDDVRDEITANVLTTKGYPDWIAPIIVVCIAIIPLTKVPLNTRPIISTIEILLGLDSRTLATANSSMVGMSGFNRGLLRVAVRVATQIVFVVIAIVFPSFDRIMTLLGSVCCFGICIILPLAFHLKLFGREMGRGERWGNWALISVSAVMAVVSTGFACLPKEIVGA